jgi:Ca-activated chloride channel family protein
MGTAVLFLFAVTVARLSGQTTTAQEPEFTLHAASELVVLNASVQTSSGANVKGLTAKDFQLFENGHVQPIKQFAAEDRPVTIGVVVDTSGSMRTRQAEVIEAALSFVRASNPADEIFIVGFNDHAFLELPSETPFSSDPRRLRDALLGRKPEGKTSLYDALVLASDHLTKGKWERKAILLISDGGDNNSRHSLADAVRAIETSGATVYTIGLFDPDEPEHNLGVLRRFSKMSGGESFTPKEVSEIKPLCLRIAESIRASYTIAYTPPQPDQHNNARKIRLIAFGQELGKLRVRTRTSYILGDH